MLKRVGVSLQFRIKNSYSFGKAIIGHMMVADNKVNSFTLGVINLFYSLDAAVEYNNEGNTETRSEVDALVGNTITLFIACRDIVFHIRIIVLQITANESHRSDAVHVVIAVDQNFFFSTQGFIKPVYSLVHVLHEKRVMQVRQ